MSPPVETAHRDLMVHSDFQSRSTRGRCCLVVDVFEGMGREAAWYNEAPREILGWLEVMW